MKFLVSGLALLVSFSQAKAIEYLAYENVKSEGLKSIRSCLMNDPTISELWYTDLNTFKKISSTEADDLKKIFSYPNEADPASGYDPLAGYGPFVENQISGYFKNAPCDLEALAHKNHLKLYSTSYNKMPYIDYLIIIDTQSNEVYIPTTGED